MRFPPGFSLKSGKIKPDQTTKRFGALELEVSLMFDF
jgi:hypothetical protein